MSASERLKVLEPFHLTVESIGEVTLYDVPLPELIAVVEAAEAVRDYEPFEVIKDDFAYDRLVESYRTAVREALVALDAKLANE